MFDRDDAYTPQGQHQAGFREIMRIKMMSRCISLAPSPIVLFNARTLVGIDNRLLAKLLIII
jgi:hypothetical protein|tara:strand:+ start:486 stop:671 length:186 start_codon:yes stop_codon:yes gene_type:complete